MPLKELVGLAFALLAVSGCCGGYSVVQTTVVDHAEMRAEEDLGTVREGEAYVLHFARAGEPPNDCGSSANYVEDLYIRVPSLRPGEVHTVDQNGVLASYERSLDGMARGATGIAGTVTISGRQGNDVEAALKIKINLSTGEVIELDDKYAFHPRTVR